MREVGAGRAGLRRPVLGHRPHLPVHGAQPRRCPTRSSRRTAWHVPTPLDLELLTLACDPFLGEHDFSAFCRRPKAAGEEPVSLVRRVRRAGWTDLGDGVLRFEIEATAFCHQMVRSIVGTVVAAGRGPTCGPATSAAILAVGRPRQRPRPSPRPQGLCLWHVAY